MKLNYIIIYADDIRIKQDSEIFTALFFNFTSYKILRMIE